MIVLMIVPTTVMSFIHSVPQENEHYSEETLHEAYGAIMSIFFLTALSVVFLFFFHASEHQTHTQTIYNPILTSDYDIK